MRKNNRRNNNKKGRRPRRQSLEAKTVRTPVRYGVTFTYAAATTQNEIALGLTAAGFSSTTRFYDLAQSFAEFRVVKLHVTAYPYSDSTTADQTFAIAYLPSTDSTTAAEAFTFVQLQQVQALALVPAKKTMPTTLSVGREYLLSTIQKWYPTDAGGNTKNDASQGSIIIKPRASATCDLVIELAMIVEFKIPTIDTLAGRQIPRSIAHRDEEVITDSEDFTIIKINKGVLKQNVKHD